MSHATSTTSSPSSLSISCVKSIGGGGGLDPPSAELKLISESSEAFAAAGKVKFLYFFPRFFSTGNQGKDEQTEDGKGGRREEEEEVRRTAGERAKTQTVRQCKRSQGPGASLNIHAVGGLEIRVIRPLEVRNVTRSRPLLRH